MKNFKLHLIKHGLTNESKKDKYIGITDVLLSKQGIDDINKQLENYYYPKVDIVFSSPLKRAYDTAKLLYPNQEVKIIEELREYDFGKFENKSLDDLKNDIDYQNYLKSSMTSTPPGGEDYSSFLNRIVKSIEVIMKYIVEEGLHDAAIICHGAIMSMLLYIFCLPKTQPYEWKFNNLEGVSIQTNVSLWMRDKVFEIYDDLPLC